MKVILLQELKGKGGEGDVVEVAPGFANNFLYPQKIAIPATKGNLKQLEQRKHNIELREETRIGGAEKFKEAIEGNVVKVVAKVGEEGQLFGSVTSVMIADAVKESLGLDIDKKRIELKAPIKTAGEYEVTISLYRDIKTTLRLFVGGADDAIPSEEAAAAVEAAEDAEAREELKAIEDAIVEEAAASIEAADAAGDAQAASEAAETAAEFVEAEDKQ